MKVKIKMKLEKDDRIISNAEIDEKIETLKNMVFLMHETNKKQESINSRLIECIESILERVDKQNAEIARLQKRWWKIF